MRPEKTRLLPAVAADAMLSGLPRVIVPPYVALALVRLASVASAELLVSVATRTLARSYTRAADGQFHWAAHAVGVAQGDGRGAAAQRSRGTGGHVVGNRQRAGTDRRGAGIGVRSAQGQRAAAKHHEADRAADRIAVGDALRGPDLDAEIGAEAKFAVVNTLFTSLLPNSPGLEPAWTASVLPAATETDKALKLGDE